MNCSNQTKTQWWIDIQMCRHWAMTMRIFTKNRDVLNIWRRNQSSLLKVVKEVKDLIEIFIFNWVSVADDWLRSTRQIERTIKLSTMTATTMMNSWHLNSCAISRTDTSRAIDDVDLFTYKSSFEWCYQLLCVKCELIDLETMNDKVSIYVQ